MSGSGRVFVDEGAVGQMFEPCPDPTCKSDECLDWRMYLARVEVLRSAARAALEAPSAEVLESNDHKGGARCPAVVDVAGSRARIYSLPVAAIDWTISGGAPRGFDLKPVRRGRLAVGPRVEVDVDAGGCGADEDVFRCRLAAFQSSAAQVFGTCPKCGIHYGFWPAEGVWACAVGGAVNLYRVPSGLTAWLADERQEFGPLSCKLELAASMPMGGAGA